MSRQIPPALFVAAAALFGLAQSMGCGEQNQNEDSPSSADLAALAACHLPNNTLGPGGHMHACDPSDTKKTTICHIPPGNPDNAHTICVGNAAVPAHIQNHGDYVGVCKAEKPCQPTPDAGGGPGGGGPGGDGGGPGGASGGGSGGAAGAGGTIIVP